MYERGYATMSKNKKLHFSLRLINQPSNQLTMVKPSRVIGRVNSKQLSPYFADPLCVHHRGLFPGDEDVAKLSETSHRCLQLMWLAVRAYYTSTGATCKSITQIVTNPTGQPFLTNFINKLRKRRRRRRRRRSPHKMKYNG
jgi:hypothetical protein